MLFSRLLRLAPAQQVWFRIMGHIHRWAQGLANFSKTFYNLTVKKSDKQWFSNDCSMGLNVTYKMLIWGTFVSACIYQWALQSNSCSFPSYSFFQGIRRWKKFFWTSSTSGPSWKLHESFITQSVFFLLRTIRRDNFIIGTMLVF